MKVLGLDIASTTGVGVIEDGKLIYYSKFSLPKTTENLPRYKAFRKIVVSIYKEHKPDIVSLEAVFMGKNVKTTAYLNGLRAIAMEALPRKAQLQSNTVGHVRKEILGSGKKHDKLEVLTFVCKTYGIDLNPKTDLDISDAILLAHWAYKVDCFR